MDKLKIISIFLIIVMIVNLILFALSKIPQLWFWGITIAIALFAYKGIPYLRKRQ